MEESIVLIRFENKISDKTYHEKKNLRCPAHVMQDLIVRVPPKGKKYFLNFTKTLTITFKCAKMDLGKGT